MIEYPVTTAIRQLRVQKIDFVPYVYEYEEKGGTAQTAKELNVDEHSVIKTIVMENEQGKPLIVLMHGDCEISTKELARELSIKKVQPCDAAKATKATGYMFGGTSPFGTKTRMPVYVESTIMDLEKIYINGGKRGFIIELEPKDIEKALDISLVNVAIK